MLVRVLICLALLWRPAIGQVSESRPRAVVVEGVVLDSIAHRPLPGAVIRLFASDSLATAGRTALSDSAGQFSISGVTPGRYTIGFLHPMLDSLGLEHVTRAIYVVESGPTHVQLAIPSAARLRAVNCGQTESTDSATVVVGTVRAASSGAATPGVTVTAIWNELIINSGTVTGSIPRRTATTAPNGWFSLCGLPPTGGISVFASRGSDSTDLIEVEIPQERFARRDLFIGPGRTAVAGAANSPAGDVVRGGNGRLSGIVVTADRRRPLPGAQVRVAGSHQTRTNERGEWTLDSVPTGTRILEVRAVSYYADRRAVHVIADATPVVVTLFTMKEMLDTVKVVAARMHNQLNGFEERRRTGFGTFLTPEDVIRMDPRSTSDLFRIVQGLTMTSAAGETSILMKGTSILQPPCPPSIFLNGTYVGSLSADKIDAWVNPDDVAGIEIYRTMPGPPPQFTRGMLGLSQEACGSIVIWTKRATNNATRASWKARSVLLAALSLTYGVFELLVRR